MSKNCRDGTNHESSSCSKMMFAQPITKLQAEWKMYNITCLSPSFDYKQCNSDEKWANVCYFIIYITFFWKIKISIQLKIFYTRLWRGTIIFLFLYHANSDYNNTTKYFFATHCFAENAAKLSLNPRCNLIIITHINKKE